MLMKKFYITLVLACLSFACFGANVHAQMPGMPPQKLSDMYDMASRGDVYGLRYAVNRGLNLETMDKHGMSGMCHAILNWDYTAYNTFRAAGANPRNPCTRRIDAKHYDAFMESGNAVAVDDSAKDAYRYAGKGGEFIVDDEVWAAVGLLGLILLAVLAL